MNSIDLQIMDLARELLITTITIAGPVLLAGLLVGIGISLFQALTSIQEQTMSQIPKMFVVMMVVLVLLIPALHLLRDYTLSVLGQLHVFGLS